MQRNLVQFQCGGRRKADVLQERQIESVQIYKFKAYGVPLPCALDKGVKYNESSYYSNWS